LISLYKLCQFFERELPRNDYCFLHYLLNLTKNMNFIDLFKSNMLTVIYENIQIHWSYFHTNKLLSNVNLCIGVRKRGGVNINQELPIFFLARKLYFYLVLLILCTGTSQIGIQTWFPEFLIRCSTQLNQDPDLIQQCKYMRLTHDQNWCTCHRSLHVFNDKATFCDLAQLIYMLNCQQFQNSASSCLSLQVEQFTSL
jgi:hypothetical protein